MIQKNDRVMVCLSGGKDSYSLLELLLVLQRKSPVKFKIIAVNLDQKQPNFPVGVIPKYLTKKGIEFHIIEQDTYSVVKEKTPEGKTTCSLCSRMRRGILYRFAQENNITKIALGHHKNDIIETFFLNMFFNASLKAMPPKLTSDDGKNTIIRPLALVDEKDLIEYSEHKKFPIIPCNLCGSQENLQRKKIKEMICQWDESNPNRSENILRSLKNITASHMLDTRLFKF